MDGDSPMKLTTIIMLFAAFIASCQRSNRSVEVTPNGNKVSPGEKGGGDEGGRDEDGSGDGKGDDSGNKTKSTGSIKLMIEGLSGSTVKIDWDFKGKSGTKEISVSSGTATATLTSMPVGTDTLNISGTVDGKAIKLASKEVTVEKGETTTVNFTVQKEGDNGDSSKGDTDVTIIPDIGGDSTLTLDWDGKSFKGNSVWKIEAIN